jgi:hypothetical protein
MSSAVLTAAAIGTIVAGGLTTAVGTAVQAEQQSKAAQAEADALEQSAAYQQQIFEHNAAQARKEAASEAAQLEGEATRAKAARMAAAAASGVDLSSGVVSAGQQGVENTKAHQLGLLDDELASTLESLALSNNATQASYTAQSRAARKKASYYSSGGLFGAGESILSSGANAFGLLV